MTALQKPKRFREAMAQAKDRERARISAPHTGVFDIVIYPKKYRPLQSPVKR